VELVAVDLGDEPVLGPVQVDLEALHDAVGGRLRQAVLAQEGANRAFQARPRRRGGAHELRQPSRGPGLHVLEPDQLAHQRLGQRRVQGIEGEVAGEIQQCAEGRGDGDSPVDGHVRVG